MRFFLFYILIAVTISGCDPLMCNNTERVSDKEVYNSIKEDFDRSEKLQSELKAVSDLDQGLERAAKENKPILLYFTGYSAVNARRIESNLLLKNMTVYHTMKDHYINVWLYTDDRKNDSKWLQYQIERFNTDFQPYFIILNSKGEPISKGLDYSQALDQLESELIKHK